jgi:hypothetical protein
VLLIVVVLAVVMVGPLLLERLERHVPVPSRPAGPAADREPT